MIISVEKVTKQCRKMYNWNVPRMDGVQVYWIKNLSNVHEQIAVQTNKILMGGERMPAWMTYGFTESCQMNPRKGNAVENYRPITSLPLVWKLLIGVIVEEMYDYPEQEKTLPEYRKGCRRGSHGTKNQLLINKTVLKDCYKRHLNLSMTWIDYKKPDDFVPHSRINECMELFEIEDKVRNTLERV